MFNDDHYLKVQEHSRVPNDPINLHKFLSTTMKGKNFGKPWSLFFAFFVEGQSKCT